MSNSATGHSRALRQPVVPNRAQPVPQCRTGQVRRRQRKPPLLSATHGLAETHSATRPAWMVDHPRLLYVGLITRESSRRGLRVCVTRWNTHPSRLICCRENLASETCSAFTRSCSTGTREERVPHAYPVDRSPRTQASHARGPESARATLSAP